MEVLSQDANFNYFKRGERENPLFWERLGGEPCFEDLKVLDVGCGVGSLCVYMALKGARRVVGLDTSESQINNAQKILLAKYPNLKNQIHYYCFTIEDLQESDFDIIVSKDTFEHLLDPSSTLAEMGKRLKKNGRIYIGFGPLYNSPFGDHGRTKSFFPWGHLLLPEKFIISRLNKYSENKITSITELGINKLSLAKFKNIFLSSGMYSPFLKVNASANPLSKVFSLLRRIPRLGELFTHNLYCILEKKKKPLRQEL